MKQVIELIRITLDGAGSGIMWSLEWEETGGPGENPRVRTGDHRALSHTPRRGSNAIRTPFITYSGLGRTQISILYDYHNIL